MKEPRHVKLVKIIVNSKEVGKVFKQDAKAIKEFLEEAEEEVKQQLHKQLVENEKVTITIGEKSFELTKEHVTMDVVDKIVQEEKYTPSVIEPSFGKFSIIYLIICNRYR